jgi:hypothetical protein
MELLTPRREHANWNVLTRCEKWFDSRDFAGGASPDEMVEKYGNLLLNAGITRLLNLLIGSGATAFNNTNSRLGVGDSSTAAAASQTDLQGTNKFFMTMDATFPTVSGQQVTFKATFGTGDANFAWQEWGIDNGSSSGATGTAPLLNRKVESLGTKTSGGTWVLTTTITIS